MELEAMGPSVPSVILDEDGNMIDSRLPSGEPLQFVFEEIKWQQELSWEEATRRLEVAMYPFKKVRQVRLPGPEPELGEQQVGPGRGVWAGLLLSLPPCGPSLGWGASHLPFRTWRRHPRGSASPLHPNTHTTHTANVQTYIHTHAVTLPAHTYVHTLPTHPRTHHTLSP